MWIRHKNKSASKASDVDMQCDPLVSISLLKSQDTWGPLATSLTVWVTVLQLLG